MDTQKSERKECMDEIFADAGGGFAVGAIGGTAFHFFKGLYSSPHGARFKGGAEAVRMNTPRVAWSLATWCGLVSTFDCALAYVRQKEDPWNSILAGAATSGLFSMRQGFLPMGKAALGGALIMAFIEGVNLTVGRPVIIQQPSIFSQVHAKLMQYYFANETIIYCNINITKLNYGPGHGIIKILNSYSNLENPRFNCQKPLRKRTLSNICGGELKQV
ncbi:hypothetical protein CTI12_AA192670 [Artemisia annua]|uniref:Mitochondrial inner membrane translocase subunit Tim17/Tim22/Tim23/peroxisomal protein PMP24 n=1 Tax=Artemisia annua TaxID=35608 RepID=A0A2U1P543_ARTAN|nr:hypothetical protein CTI12_AA192670 [Artemisia annua]